MLHFGRFSDVLPSAKQTQEDAMKIRHQWIPKISDDRIEYVSIEDIKDMEKLIQQLSPKAPAFTGQKLKNLRLDAHIIVLRDYAVRHADKYHKDIVRSPIVAMTTVFVMHLPQGKRAHIENVVVDEKYRGKGVGRQMMECIEAWALMQGVKGLQLTSRRPIAQKMYERLGYAEPATKLYRKNL